MTAEEKPKCHDLCDRMIAEARKLRGFTQTPDTPGWTDIAEQIEMWVEEVRGLGVDLAVAHQRWQRSQEGHEITITALQNAVWRIEKAIEIIRKMNPYDHGDENAKIQAEALVALKGKQ